MAAPPPLSAVGPQGALAGNAAVRLRGTYDHQRFGTVTAIAPGSVLNHCDLPGFTVFEKGVTLNDCRVRGGLWFEDGAQDGWNINRSILDGGSRQSLRPKGPGVLRISDSWLLLSNVERSDAVHTEAMQCLNGSDVIADRVAFSAQPNGGNGITAVLTFDSVFAANGALEGWSGKNSVLTDIVVGYWNGTGWVAGGGAFAIYPGAATFIRPTIHGNPWFVLPAPGKLIEGEVTMPAVYLIDVQGDGLSLATAYQFPPAIHASQGWTLLMIDTVRPNKQAMKGLIVHPSNTVTGTGVRKLFEAGSKDALVSFARTTAPPPQVRNIITSWLSAADIPSFPPGSAWGPVIQHVLDQINPGVNFEAAILALP